MRDNAVRVNIDTIKIKPIMADVPSFSALKSKTIGHKTHENDVKDPLWGLLSRNWLKIGADCALIVHQDVGSSLPHHEPFVWLRHQALHLLMEHSLLSGLAM